MKKMLLLLCLLFVWSSNEMKSQQKSYVVVNTEIVCPGIIFQIDAGLDSCGILFPEVELIPFTQPSYIDCSAHGIEFIMSRNIIGKSYNDSKNTVIYDPSSLILRLYVYQTNFSK